MQGRTADDDHGLAATLPTLAQLDKGSTTVHASIVGTIPNPIDRRATMHYPRTIALCGAKVWGPYSGHGPGSALDAVNCARCMDTRRWQAANA